MITVEYIVAMFDAEVTIEATLIAKPTSMDMTTTKTPISSTSKTGIRIKIGKVGRILK